MRRETLQKSVSPFEERSNNERTIDHSVRINLCELHESVFAPPRELHVFFARQLIFRLSSFGLPLDWPLNRERAGPREKVECRESARPFRDTMTDIKHVDCQAILVGGRIGVTVTPVRAINLRLRFPALQLKILRPLSTTRVAYLHNTCCFWPSVAFTLIPENVADRANSKTHFSDYPSINACPSRRSPTLAPRDRHLRLFVREYNNGPRYHVIQN